MEILLLIIIITLGVFLYFFKNKDYIFFKSEEEYREKIKEYPHFKRKDFLMNIPERKFFEKLEKIIPENYIVFPQILLSSIVKVISYKKDFWKYHNKINKKTIDYVIFEKPYFKPVIAVEYDGKTHTRKDRQLRDHFVNKVLNSTGIKSLHINHQKNINFEEIKNKINELLTSTKNYQITSDNKVYEVQEKVR